MSRCFHSARAGVLSLLWLCLLLHGCASVSRSSREASRFVSGMKESFDQTPGQLLENNAAGGSLGRYFIASPPIAALKRDWLRQGLELKLKKRKIFPKLNVQFFNQSYIGEKNLDIKNITEGGLSFQYKIEDLLFYGASVSLADRELNRIVLRIRQAIQNEIMKMKKLKLKKEYINEALKLSGQALNISATGAEIARIGALNDGTGEELLKKLEWEENENTFRQAVERELFNLDICELEIKESFNVSDSGSLNENLFLSPQVEENERVVKNALVDHSGFKLAWSKRIDVKEAEGDLAAREIELSSSSYVWLKYIGISMGYGKYYVFKDNDFSRINFRVTLNVPVLDYGETRSIKEMARQDRDQTQQRIQALARKINADISSEVKKLGFLEKELAIEEANLGRNEKLLETFKLRFAGNRAADLLLQKKMELELTKMQLKYREKRYLRDTQKLEIDLMLGILSDPKVETSIIDEIIDFWQKG
jgi:hypothetical protein